MPSCFDQDTKSGQTLTAGEAEERKVIVAQLGVFRDTLTGRDMLISQAVEQGLIEIEYEGGPPVPEIESSAYAVRAVLDKKRKRMIPFKEAVRKKIIDQETGNYTDTTNGSTMPIGEQWSTQSTL